MLGFNFRAVRALVRKEAAIYLGNPTGYVFLTLFIATTAAAAFLDEGFFSRNLADLAVLNQMMPAILMLFVPAVTMNVWAEERRGGTEELLLTMPIRDGEVILGKYLGAIVVYTVALAFSLAHLAVLRYLGSPDVGLMFSTYLGYWLMGSLFVSVGLLGSMFSSNATVGFILGAVGCSALVFSGAQPWTSGLVGVGLCAGFTALLALVVTGKKDSVAISGFVGAVAATLWWLGGDLGGALPIFTSLFDGLGVEPHFTGFGQGIVRLGDVLYFLGGTSIALVLGGVMLGRRHW